MEEHLIGKKKELMLVNSKDEIIGKMSKEEVHKKGLLHRALSIFIFNDKNELMIQRRALSKYHSAGLWANTSCSHPFYGETLEKAAFRRIEEEMGFRCKLEWRFFFIYKAHLDNGLIEHELDHVFTGRYNLTPFFNKEEVCDWKWVSLKDLREQIKKRSKEFAPWFKIIMDQHIEKLPWK